VKGLEFPEAGDCDLNKDEHIHDRETQKKLPPQQPNRDIIITKEIHFLLCEACLWCVSYLRRNYGSTISKCPACNSGRIESIPIFRNDIYRFDYDPKPKGYT
jgi:hypothetical protein